MLRRSLIAAIFLAFVAVLPAQLVAQTGHDSAQPTSVTSSEASSAYDSTAPFSLDFVTFPRPDNPEPPHETGHITGTREEVRAKLDERSKMRQEWHERERLYREHDKLRITGFAPDAGWQIAWTAGASEEAVHALLSSNLPNREELLRELNREATEADLSFEPIEHGYRISGFPPTTSRVQFFAPTGETYSATLRRSPDAPPTVYKVQSDRQAIVRVRVMARDANGALVPLADSDIMFEAESGNDGNLGWWGRERSSEPAPYGDRMAEQLFTDANGEVLLRGARDRVKLVEARAPGYFPVTRGVRFVENFETVETFVLQREAPVIEVTIADPNGNPVTQMCAYAITDPWKRRLNSHRGRIQPDAQGRATIQLGAYGKFIAAYGPVAHYRTKVDTPLIDSPGPTPVRVIRTETGSGMADVPVVIQLNGEAPPPIRQITLTSVTELNFRGEPFTSWAGPGPSGAATIPKVQPDLHDLTAHIQTTAAGGFQIVPLGQHGVAVDQTEPIVIELADRMITGRVELGGEGTAVEGGRVFAWRVTEDGLPVDIGRADPLDRLTSITQADGSFAIYGVTPGWWLVSATPNLMHRKENGQRAIAWRRVYHDGDGVLDLGDPLSLSPEVANVIIRGSNVRTYGGTPAVAAILTEEGDFLLPDSLQLQVGPTLDFLPPGNYALFGRAAHEDGESGTLIGATDFIEFMTPERWSEVAPEPTPRPASMHIPGPPPAPITTPAQGAVFPAAPSGTYTYDPTNGTSSGGGVWRIDDGKPQPMTITLDVPRTAYLDWRVTDENGVPIEDAALAPTPLSESLAPILTSRLSPASRFAEQGWHLAHNLPLGDYRVEITAPGFQPLTVDQVTLDAGSTPDRRAVQLVRER